ncbi:F-type H+-transporting ATPase subunit epsilon [Tenacibaculum adriaticum]|uniref:F-type H+-transporting ATPase subunit epsilon n=1 Tax=Tenacibaculum adriaticum TaxID=413713 RepID=A0A5S5DUQ0_9FLAO|nr:F0F1 ATP synthase subunit epsilon [Tenacibaculum adriaticum]TYP99637.1 F-type H+-transporting ATPase subunit epsilon [Tenacibaculum adriaticum]
MFLEIVTPEAVLFSSEVTSVAVPGINGEFQMLSNHAPVVSLLNAGIIKIEASKVSIDEKFEDRFTKTVDGRLGFSIKSGTLEMKDNKAIILAD